MRHFHATETSFLGLSMKITGARNCPERQVKKTFLLRVTEPDTCPESCSFLCAHILQTLHFYLTCRKDSRAGDQERLLPPSLRVRCEPWEDGSEKTSFHSVKGSDRPHLSVP